jgi:glycosyltransferase involved in cell wall biosynthesis
MDRTRVSILTSVLNQKDLLKGMIDSVIAQTYKQWELVIVDDGSTDDIKGLVESFNENRIRYFRFPENRGVPHGSNFAFDMAVFPDYCQWLAADERISPTKLAEQVEYLDSHPGVDAVWGLPTYFKGGRITDDAFGPRPSWEQYFLRAHNRSNESWLRTLLELDNVPLGSCSMLARREVLKSLGSMDTKLKAFSDHELFCRFFSAGKVGVVLPHRWAVDVPREGPSVQSQANIQEELSYVRSKHPLKPPVSTGKITVGIPCFNHAKYLTAAVESVLNQTRQVDEILILNDASTDNFEEVARELKDSRIKLMAFPENMGCQEAKTQMAYRASGDFFCVLSADDTLDPTFIEKVMKEFEKNPWIEFAASQTDFLNEDGSPHTDKSHPFYQIPQAVNRTREQWVEALRPGNHYFGAGIYRTKMISDVGGWNKEFKIIDDYEMYLKIIQREGISIVEEPLTHTRISGQNQSLVKPDLAEELPTLYFKAKAPYYRQLMKVVIATPFYELKGFSPYIASLLATVKLLTQVGIQWEFMELSGDSYVHRARNTMCDRFLQDPDATDLFFIDSDMSWDPAGFVKMCLLPDDVVGGSYPVKHGESMWTSIPQMFEENDAYHYKGRELGDGTALLQAFVLAGGFLRIKRNVLERFRNHYPTDWYKEPSTDPSRPEKKYSKFFAAEQIDGMFYGEDHYFSRKLREMGTPMFIYPNVTISHFFTKPHTGNLDQWLKQQKYEQEKKPLEFRPS